MDLHLEGRRAVISGGSKGIGLEIARRLLNEGAHVSIAARNAEGLESALAELRPLGAVHGQALDVADREAVFTWVKAAADEFGGLDLVFANASATGGIPKSPEGWRMSYEVDMMGTVHMVDAAMPMLEASAVPAIVKIATITAIEHHDFPANPSYGAMKAASLNYIAQLAQFLGPKGIRANAVSPGPIYIEGGVWDWIRANMTAYYERDLAAHPLQRKAGDLKGHPMGAASDVADAAVFLASPIAGWITGENLVVDGGFTRRVGF